MLPLIGAERFARHTSTLDRLHAPVATSRRIAFLQCGSAPTTDLITHVESALSAVPGRRVVVQPEGPNPDLDAAARNADVCLTNLGAFTTLADAVRIPSRHHALCLVAGTARAEADPTIALAETLTDSYGLTTIVALRTPQPAKWWEPGFAGHWATLVSRRLPDRVIIIPASPRSSRVQIATLAGALMHAAITTPAVREVEA